jgi:hypothetical protein
LFCFLILGWFDSCELRKFCNIERLRASWLWEVLLFYLLLGKICNVYKWHIVILNKQRNKSEVK